MLTVFSHQFYFSRYLKINLINFLNNICFCPAKITGINKNNRPKWKYPYLTCFSPCDYTAETSSPSLFNQNELNDLIRDLSLSKEASELLASRLKEKN